MSGSFPLMAIARQYGVDYADVLMVALAEAMLRERFPRDAGNRRWGAACEALGRILNTVGYPRLYDVTRAIEAHAEVRWGPQHAWRGE